MCDQQSLRSACAYAQSDQSLFLSLKYYMTVKQLSEYHLEFLSLKRCCTVSSETTLVKMPHCWKSHVTAHLCVQKHRMKIDKWVYLLLSGWVIHKELSLNTCRHTGETRLDALSFLNTYLHSSCRENVSCFIRVPVYIHAAELDVKLLVFEHLATSSR